MQIPRRQSASGDRLPLIANDAFDLVQLLRQAMNILLQFDDALGQWGVLGEKAAFA